MTGLRDGQRRQINLYIGLNISDNAGKIDVGGPLGPMVLSRHQRVHGRLAVIKGSVLGETLRGSGRLVGSIHS
ncbi:hypothetical protein [Spirosoma sp. KNUC1025]|uniref:hypothetical protein n=1 Tax=Spirosoma sp. KNUC1025 TaxID=2894082 RepID=UPI00386E5633|nr:hypothetical protein LN737_32465 [Spirosoma sp. KNUC1025]